MTTNSPKQEVASGYGEGDAEADAMTDAAKQGAVRGDPVTEDSVGPAAGTTASDIAKNLDTKRLRETKS